MSTSNNIQPQQQNTDPVSGVWQFSNEEFDESIPVGQYEAEFSGFEACDTEYGEKLRLKWKITRGANEGQIASTLVGLPRVKLGPKHTLYKFAIAFLGRQLVEGEEIDFNPFIGMRGNIIVSPTQSGKGTKVTAFLPTQGQTLTI